MKQEVPTLKAFTVGDQRLDINALLNAPYEDIREAAERIPSAIGWLGYHRALAMERMIIAEQAWKSTDSKVYFDLKNGAFVSKGLGEKVTEEGLKRAVEMSDEAQQSCLVYAKHKRNVEWFSVTIEALKAKLELTRSSEVTRRLEDDPRI